MASSGDMPGGSRGCTPSHPPYALMIGTALRSLAEEGGSTEDVISAYIVANYDGLPWGHDKLLPYYLQRLTEQGEFIAVGPGRYSIAGDDTEPRPALATEGDLERQARTRQNAELRAPWTPAQKEQSCVQEEDPKDYKLLMDENV